MERPKINYAKSLQMANIAYLGAVKSSAKLNYSYNRGWETYGIYLAPATLARDEKHPYINNCPFSKMCAASCLNGSGQNKCSTLHMKKVNQLSHVDKSRIKKTHLFYDNLPLFMDIMLAEINRFKNHAQKHGMGFAIRLNCTSDLSPERFIYNGKNILELFPDIQFYDYTKVPSHLALAEKYPNYDITFSYDGTNFDVCKEWLEKGGKVAVVFDLYDNRGRQVMPETWNGYRVVSGNEYDMRFLDPKGCIIGLHYHRVANDYLSGEYKPTNTPFVVRSL